MIRQTNEEIEQSAAMAKLYQSQAASLRERNAEIQNKLRMY